MELLMLNLYYKSKYNMGNIVIRYIVLLLLTLVLPAQADIITISAYDSGWYTESGIHDSYNRNTLTRASGSSSSTPEYRGFLLWDTSALDGYDVISAQVQFQYSSAGYDPVDGKFYDVSSQSISDITLTNGGGNGVTIFNDLGTGNSYSNVSVIGTPWEVLSTFELNSNAIADLNNADLNIFGFGMISTENSYWPSYTFTTSQIYGYENLILEVKPIPLPPSILLFLSGILLLIQRIINITSRLNCVWTKQCAL